jgi:alpha-amylase
MKKTAISHLLTVVSFVFLLQFTASAQVNNPKRQVVLQGFWWDYWNSNFPNDWANYLTELAPRLKALGIDAIWIPPTIKNTGTNSVGYAPFDHYDLGDKYQKNSSGTRLGDKDELLRMVAVMKANGIDVIQDIVLNHVTGAGSGAGLGGQDPAAMDDGQTNKFKNFRYSSYTTPALQETEANYLSRSGRFHKNWQNFYPNPSAACCNNDINQPYWGPDVSYEAGAFGTSSNALYNPAQTSNYMRDGMRNWLIWYKKQVGWDGVRLDAVKHFPSYVSEDFLWNLQFGSLWANGGNDMFAVGEWVGGGNELDSWANAVQNRAGTFDFALRNAFTGIVSGNGNFDLGSVPGYQQSNRERTVPFVNNHDTYRPTLSTQGNYTGWNTGSELAPHIEPNDGRRSVVHAIALAVDGAPQLFFEDLFNIGYLGNRFNHEPTNTTQLPVFSDIENLIWCHQNLRFKEGNYLVRWQAADALVFERQAKALIAVNDQWTQWQNLSGVQTSWPDGTVLSDYSGANGTATATVYGGGKVDIAIPPCDGTASQGRRGYAVWAPQGIAANYNRPAKRITQEWEMSNDLGDNHVGSLQQGGALPNNSTDCRVVGRVFAKAGEKIYMEVYPEQSDLALTLQFVDKDCQLIDSFSNTGNIIDSVTATYTGWHTFKIKNATAQQPGQKCWVKVNYLAPDTVDTGIAKNKCACTTSSNASLVELNEALDIQLFPNPAESTVFVVVPGYESVETVYQIINGKGQIMQRGKLLPDGETTGIVVSQLESGWYFLEMQVDGQPLRKAFVVK